MCSPCAFVFVLLFARITSNNLLPHCFQVFLSPFTASVFAVPSVGMSLYGFRVSRPKCWDGLLRLPCLPSPVLGWPFTGSVFDVPSVGMTFYGFRVSRPQCLDLLLRVPSRSSPVFRLSFTAFVWGGSTDFNEG